MPTNFYLFFIAGFIPMIVGAIYYHPKVAGTAWMRINQLREEDLSGGNMALIMGMAYLLSVILSFFLSFVVIHQGGALSMMYPEVLESGSAAQAEFNALMAKYGDNQRGFGHGALHGIMATLLFLFPVIGIISIFERRSWKYVLVHVGYWAISLALVGGLLCSLLHYAPLS